MNFLLRDLKISPQEDADTEADQDADQVNPLHLACKKIVHTYAAERGFADFEI